MDLLPGQLVADKWRVTERLDRAAHAHVYRVDGIPGGEPAILEVAAAPRNRTLGELARFDREARIASHVKHVRLARIVDFGTWKERPFVVSEVPRGKPLASLIGTSEMTGRRAVGICSQVLEVLGYLHAHGVVHRDVTSENVLVIESAVGDQVRLPPPGLGLADASVAARREDQTGDLLAVGRLLRAMCEGLSTPTDAGGEEAGTETSERALGERLAGVIARATAPQPSARFQSADEMLLALVRAGGIAGPPAPGRRPRRRPKVSPARRAAKTSRFRDRLLWPVVGVVAIAGAGVVIASSRTRPGAPSVVGAPPASKVALGVPPSRPPSPPPPPPQSPSPTSRPSALPTSSAAPSARPPSPSPPPPRTPPPLRPPPPRPSPGSIAAVKPPPSRTLPIPPESSRRPSPPAEPPTVPAGDAAEPALEASEARALPGPAIALVPITAAERAEVLGLIEARDNQAAAEKITALMQRDPRVAWPHVALAELHFRNLWRREVVRQWHIALSLDPAVKADPHLAKHLCQARGPKWEAAGIGELVAELGEQGAALLASCPS